MVSKIMQKLDEENKQKGCSAKFSIGDTVRVHTKIREGEKDRIQVFAGTVIARKGRGAHEAFIVRRVSHGVGVEKIFPVFSPHIAKVEVQRGASVRRAKLYFLRALSGKKARLREGTQSEQ